MKQVLGSLMLLLMGSSALAESFTLQQICSSYRRFNATQCQQIPFCQENVSQSGSCNNNAANPGFAMLCALQERNAKILGQNPKAVCQNTIGCEWVVNVDSTVCQVRSGM